MAEETLKEKKTNMSQLWDKTMTPAKRLRWLPKCGVGEFRELDSKNGSDYLSPIKKGGNINENTKQN